MLGISTSCIAVFIHPPLSYYTYLYCHLRYRNGHHQSYAKNDIAQVESTVLRCSLVPYPPLINPGRKWTLFGLGSLTVLKIFDTDTPVDHLSAAVVEDYHSSQLFLYVYRSLPFATGVSKLPTSRIKPTLAEPAVILELYA